MSNEINVPCHNFLNIYTREYLKPVSQMIKKDLSDSL